MLRSYRTIVLGIGLLAGTAIGCHSDRPHEYGEERPPVDRLDRRDSGLQSKDVVAASDQMAMDLLAQPEINQNPNRTLIVVDHVENRTTSGRFDLDIFLERLRVNLAKYGKGRVQLVENRDKLRELQSRELEQPGGDRFGQGGNATSRARPGGDSAGFLALWSDHGNAQPGHELFSVRVHANRFAHARAGLDKLVRGQSQQLIAAGSGALE